MYYGTPPIVTNGLVGYFDVSNEMSYTSGSLIWKDLTGTCDLILTGSGILPTYWIGNRESIPAIATIPLNTIYSSNDFTTANWSKTKTGYTCTITASVISPPPGLQDSGSKLNETTVNSFHGIQSSLSTAIGSQFRISFYLKAAERTWARIGDPDWAGFYCHFDLVNGVTGSKSVGPATYNGVPFQWTDIRMDNVGDGWWRCSYIVTPGFDSTSFIVCPIINNATSSYVGNPTSGIYIYGASGTYGPELTPYVDTSTSGSRSDTTSYLEYTGSAIQENNTHSVFVWVKGLTNPGSRLNMIYSKYSQPTKQGITYTISSDTALALADAAGLTSINVGLIFGYTRPLTAHGWAHVGIVRSTGQTKMYWNGNLIFSTGRFIATATTSSVKFGNAIDIGNVSPLYQGYSGLGFNNIMIYNREVTDAEAMQNFNALKTKFRNTSPQRQFGIRTATIN